MINGFYFVDYGDEEFGISVRHNEWYILGLGDLGMYLHTSIGRDFDLYDLDNDDRLKVVGVDII